MISANYEHRPKRFLSRTVLLLVLSLLAYAAAFSWQSWQDAKDEESTRLAAIADVGGKGLDTYFVQLELAMQELGRDLDGTRKQLDLDRAFDRVSRFQRLHSELESITLIRADGQLLMTGNMPYSRDLPALGNNSAFISLRDELRDNPAFVIGQPVGGDIDKDWVIPARYGIRDPSGKLAYIINANLPVDLVQRQLVDSPAAGAMAIGLVRDDGYLAGLYPRPDAARLGQIYGQPVTGTMLEYLRANSFPRLGQVEGSGIVFAGRAVQVTHRLKHFPLTLFIEMPEQEIRAMWWRRAQEPYFLMLLMLAGILAVQGWSFRRHKVWSRERRRETIRRNFERSLREHNPNEIYLFDADSLAFNHANDLALGNLGYSIEALRQQTFLSLHPEMSRGSFAELIAPLRQEKQISVSCQTVQVRADGSSYPVEIELQFLTSHGRHECLAIVNDITELRQAEENLSKFNSPVERRSSVRKPANAASASPAPDQSTEQDIHPYEAG